MRPEDRDLAHLWDMLEAASAVVDFTMDMALEEFTAEGIYNEMVRLAVERKLEILGEAAGRVSAQFRNKHPELPWRKMVGLRNIISHKYDNVNYEEIYNIVHDNMPELITSLEAIMPPPPTVEE